MSRGDKPTVLVIDDNKVVLEIVVQHFSLHDVYVITTTRSSIGDALAQGIENLMAIVLDVDMPEMDGRTLSAALRKNPRYDKVPIIFFTGMDRERIEQVAERISSASVVSKSAGVDALWEEFERVTAFEDVEDVELLEEVEITIEPSIEPKRGDAHLRATVRPPNSDSAALGHTSSIEPLPSLEPVSSVHGKATVRPPNPKKGHSSG